MVSLVVGDDEVSIEEAEVHHVAEETMDAVLAVTKFVTHHQVFSRCDPHHDDSEEYLEIREVGNGILHVVEDEVVIDPVGAEVHVERNEEAGVLLTHTLLPVRVVLGVLGGVELEDGEGDVNEEEVEEVGLECPKCQSSEENEEGGTRVSEELDPVELEKYFAASGFASHLNIIIIVITTHGLEIA